MPQLASMTIHSGFEVYFKCPYHAMVMNVLETMSNRTVIAVAMRIDVNEILSAYELIHIMLLESRHNRITTMTEFCYRDSINFGTPQAESVFDKL